jgi:hypothetical protein
MDGWDLALLAIAGYVAIVALVRLMIRRRDQLVGELVEEAEKKRRQAGQSASPPSPSRQGKIA